MLCFSINPFLDQITHLQYNLNSADPVQMPQDAASDQGPHCLLTGISMQNNNRNKKTSTMNPKTRNGLIQMY